MKIHYILCAAGIAFSQLAMAEPSLTGQSLGTVQATVDFCAQINPGVAKKYQEQVWAIVSEVPVEELDKARHTAEYKEAYAQISAELGVVSKRDAQEACNGFLEPEPSGPTGPISENEGMHDERTN